MNFHLILKFQEDLGNEKLFASVLFCCVVLSHSCCNVISKEIESHQFTNMVRLLEEMPQDENAMVSPFSIKQAFLLAANGAENETQKEILDVFNVSDLNKSNHEFKNTAESLTKSGAINTANSVWVNGGENIKFNDEYIEIIKKYYDAHAQEVNNKNAVETINNWVSDKTNGKIGGIIDDSNFLSVLINVVHFKADFEKAFKKENTRKRAFTEKNGNEIQVDFMQQKGIFDFYENEDLQLVEMKYNNKNLSLCVILPKPGKEITAENLQKAMENKRPERVDIKLPKFRTETSLELSDTMKKLGMQRAFNESCPDFRNVMFKGLPENITAYFSKVIHKSFIEVDEKDTEAAAVTAIELFATACPVRKPESYKDFDANRPFIYLINDNRSGEILFIGKQSRFN